MRQKNGISYNISRNGSAGDWYWEVISDRKIIERGLAPTSTQARAEAICILSVRQPGDSPAQGECRGTLNTTTPRSSTTEM
jgi:hypothetical protein